MFIIRLPSNQVGAAEKLLERLANNNIRVQATSSVNCMGGVTHRFLLTDAQQINETYERLTKTWGYTADYCEDIAQVFPVNGEQIIDWLLTSIPGGGIVRAAFGVPTSPVATSIAVNIRGEHDMARARDLFDIEFPASDVTGDDRFYPYFEAEVPRVPMVRAFFKVLEQTDFRTFSIATCDDTFRKVVLVPDNEASYNDLQAASEQLGLQLRYAIRARRGSPMGFGDIRGVLAVLREQQIPVESMLLIPDKPGQQQLRWCLW